MRPVRVEPVSVADGRHWNAYVERHHYLGYTPLPGTQLRYRARAAAWKTAATASHHRRPDVVGRPLPGVRRQMLTDVRDRLPGGASAIRVQERTNVARLAGARGFGTRMVRIQVCADVRNVGVRATVRFFIRVEVGTEVSQFHIGPVPPGFWIQVLADVHLTRSSVRIRRPSCGDEIGVRS